MRLPLKSLLLAVLLALGACTAREIRTYNSDLTQLSLARQDALRAVAASRSDPAGLADAATRLEHSEGQLATLMREASKAAAETADQRLKVSYYRIAVTAGWQAGVPVNEQPASPDQELFLDSAAKGLEVCKQPANARLQGDMARDCAIIAVAPYLAKNDQAVRQVRPVSEIVTRRTGMTAELRNQVANAGFNTYEVFLAAAAGLAQNRATWSNPVLNPVFVDTLRIRQGQVECNAVRAASYVLLMRDDDPEKARRLGQIVARFQANGIDFNQRRATCPDQLA
jgi:hypothetical protein